MNEVGFPYLDELNEIQRNAVVATDGPIMVIAGPGSGKTRVLTYKIAHLLKTGVPPYQILSLTFTNKAAKEMKERIEKLVGQGANKIWAGTFHSIFAKILRVEAHRIGYPNDFTIYDTDDSKSLIREIVKTMGLDKNTYNNNAVRSRISGAKSQLITPKKYASNNDLIEADKMNRRPLLYKIYDQYQKRCERAGAMDFDDLLLQMFRLLYQNPDNIRAKYQKQFKYLLVDEFQDTNYLQYEILKLFIMYQDSPNNICIVGDDAQSIYSFRGATIENILQFEQDFKNVQVFKLEQNYRSTNHIVQAANDVINYNKNQINKTIWTDRQEGNKIKIIKALSDSEEGKKVVDLILEQKNRFHLANDQMAILYRTNAQSRVFEEHLRRANLPYKIYGGLSFYSRKEIKDIIAYFRLATNSRDDEALKRVINFPKRGIGASTLDKVRAIADEHEASMWDCLSKMKFNARAGKKIEEFVGMIKTFQEKAKTADAYETAMFISKKCGIIQLFREEATIEAQNRLENINALLDAIQEFSEQDVVEEGAELYPDRKLSTFLQSISLMTDQDDSEKEATRAITLMSTHAAKGLEYKSVFVVGLEENLFPSYMSLSSPDQIDEERRLFYVAITRAEEYLTLSYANSRYQYGQMRFNDPSRFIDEISVDNIEATLVMRNVEKVGFGPPKKLQGNFGQMGTRSRALAMDPKDFKVSPLEDLVEGVFVMHLRFGRGKIIKVDDRKFATIRFDNVPDNPEKLIALKASKLQVLS